eukprot:666889_1
MSQGSTASTESNEPRHLGKYVLLLLTSCGAGYILYRTFKKAHAIDQKKQFHFTMPSASILNLSLSPVAVDPNMMKPLMKISNSMDVAVAQEASMNDYMQQKGFQSPAKSQSSLSDSFELPLATRHLARQSSLFERQASEPEFALSNTFLGESSYRETVIFLLALATYRVFPDEQLIICNTFKFGTSRRSYFCRFDSNSSFNDASIRSIQDEMLKLSAMQLDLKSKFIDYDTCERMLVNTNQNLSVKLVQSLNRPCYRMVGVDFDNDNDNAHYILQHRATLSNTKYCTRFQLHASDDCKSHFVVRFNEENDDQKCDRKQPQAIRELYQRGVEMSQYLNINSVSDINDVIQQGRFKQLMLLSESYHDRQIVKISNKIAHRRKQQDTQIRIICISGPSSSGKTTFASKLAIQLRLLGMLPTVLEVDMYYRNRSDPCHPRDAEGHLNFEVIEAVKLTEFNVAINRLLNGEAIRVPNFDFKTGNRSGYQKESLQLDANNGVLIMEGIFCLNPKLLGDVKGVQDVCYKIFICPISPFYALDNFHFISEQVMRLIRRISRDHFHRNKCADQVVFKWGQLSEGEDLNIFPYVRYADAVFNSALMYETCVLKTYSYPLLQTVQNKSNSYKDAQNLLAFLDCFFSMPDRSVPHDSLLMEFIGTSIFDEI